jgi:hypothetical protein
MEDYCPYLVRIFCACLATIYVPAIWLQVKIVLIPKTSRSSYTRPRDFRSISLISFLLKIMERLVDRFLRNEDPTLKPLHPNQHIYQAGKFKETALHQLMVWVGKVLGQQKMALGVFIDVERALKNTSSESMCAALVRHGLGYISVWWSRAILEDCLAMMTFNGNLIKAAVSRG